VKSKKLSKASKYFSDMYTSFQGRNLNRAINCLEGINKLPKRFNFSSFTIFLNCKKNYSGGKLSIEGFNSEKKFKLDAGEIIIYPSTYLHSVEEVIDGERLVFIGWIESYVKSIEEREYLFDLDAAARSLLAKYGRSDEVDLIFKSYSNLLRRLGS